MTSSVRVVLYGTDATLSKALAGAGLAARGASKEIEDLGSKSSKFSQLAAVGKAALIGIAGASAVIGAVSVKMGANFQQSMELIRTQAGASQAEVNRMSKAVLNLAGPTATAPMQLSEALFHIESTSARGAKALAELKIAAEGAKVGNADLTDVTNALNATIVSGIAGSMSFSQAMGALNGIVGAGDMHMEDLAEALGTGVLPVVKGFGVSLQSVGGALATFGDNNIRGADAATALRMSVMSLAKPAATGAAALKSIGLSSSQLGATMSKSGLNAAVGQLVAHLKAAGDTGAKAGQVLTNAFGKKAGIGLDVLVSQYGRFETKTAEVSRGANQFGAAWTATTKTLNFQIDQLKATGDALATRLGLALIPKLEQVAKVTDQVVIWFEKHKQVALTLAVAVGSVLVVAIGAYTVAMAQAAIATVAATWPVLAIIAAVAAVGVGIYELVTHWSTVWNAIKGVAQTVWKDALKPVFDAIVTYYKITLVQPLEVMGRAFTTVWRAIQTAVKATMTALKPIFDDLVEYLQVTIVDPLKILGDLFRIQWALMSLSVRVAWALMQPIFQGIAIIWRDLVLPQLRILEAAFIEVWKMTATVVRDAWNLMKPVLDELVKIGLDVIVDEIDLVETVWKTSWDLIIDEVKLAWSIIKPIFDAITKAAGDVSTAVGKVTGIAGAVTGGITHTISHLHIPGVHMGATGGVVTRPTLAVLGENGTEVVRPIGSLDTAPGAHPLATIAPKGGAASAAAAQPLVIQLVVDRKVLAEIALDELRNQKKSGRLLGLS